MSAISTNAPIESPFRWAGSKRALLPKLRALLPSAYGRYIEPFAGSACLYFATNSTPALLADFNPHLIDAYQAIRTDCESMYDVLETLSPTGDDYYEVRAEFNSCSRGTKQSAYFVYLNRFGFNGVYRTNRAGKYNVPRGNRTGRLKTRQEFATIADALQPVEIACLDFRDSMAEAQSGDLLYVDPPYATTYRHTYGEYGYGAFGGEGDINDMVAELESATLRGVKVIFSFGDLEPFNDLLTTWEVEQFSSRRRISGDLTSRSTYYHELIATNFRRQ